MAHSNGKIYIDTSGTTPIGISDSDIQAVLGTSLYSDIGGLISYGVAQRLINKWAKYKPVEHNSPGPSTDALRKAALHGMPNIPVYTGASELTAALRTGITEGNHWPLSCPQNWFRHFDFDGYIHKSRIPGEWGAMGVQSAKALNFPFEGRLWTTDDIIHPYSQIDKATVQPSDPELTPTGLLYPDDFAGTTLPFPDWYFGVLCTPSTPPVSGNTDLWLVTSDTQMKYFEPDDDILTDVPFTLNESQSPIGTGSYKLFPVFCLNRIWNGVGTPHFVNVKNTWSGGSGGPGNLVLIDGYCLPVTLSGGGGELEFSFSVSGTNATFTVRNTIRLPITMYGNQFFGYITADGLSSSEENEVLEACDDWHDSGTELTAGVFKNGVLVGRYINLMAAFRAANNNSSEIAANSSVTFTVAIGASADGHGTPYNRDSEFYICHNYAYQGTNPEKRYNILDQ